MAYLCCPERSYHQPPQHDLHEEDPGLTVVTSVEALGIAPSESKRAESVGRILDLWERDPNHFSVEAYSIVLDKIASKVLYVPGQSELILAVLCTTAKSAA
jgi:hypothetical protein